MVGLYGIIIRCRIRLHNVLHIYIRQFYYYIFKSDLEPIYCYICDCRLVWCCVTINRRLICSLYIQLLQFNLFFLFFLFVFMSLFVFFLHIPGVRVKYKLFALLFSFFSFLFFSNNHPEQGVSGLQGQGPTTARTYNSY